MVPWLAVHTNVSYDFDFILERLSVTVIKKNIANVIRNIWLQAKTHNFLLLTDDKCYLQLVASSTI